MKPLLIKRLALILARCSGDSEKSRKYLLRPIDVHGAACFMEGAGAVQTPGPHHPRNEESPVMTVRACAFVVVSSAMSLAGSFFLMLAVVGLI